ncbi:MAG: hypothetical protein HKN72_15635 [Gemmatimonadetes bacterium]|nr:hypothetical protein [Gemmatimonadota bacterium]
MRLAAAFTATGIIGFLLLEALKIVLAPVALWLMGVVMVAVKVLMLGVGAAVVILAIVASIWGYRRWTQSRGEVAF